MTILRMYLTNEGAKRPTQYREAWWEEDTHEFVLHHGKVGEVGTTTVETVSNPQEVESLFASLFEQNRTDDYLEIDDVPQELFTVSIQYKADTPTVVERSNAEKFLATYTGLLGWRGLGSVDHWEELSSERQFVFSIRSVHRNKAMKLASQAIEKTDFRADRMSIQGA